MKVLDLSTLLPGPLASKLLMDIGAEVIKIENPNNPDLLKTIKPTKEGIGVSYLYLNEGKNTINLDLKDKMDKERFIELVKDADVLIENFRPNRMSKMDLGYEELKAVNPNLIYCAITGYGYNHPLSRKAAHDINILAVSGYLEYELRYLEYPTIPPIQMADILTSYNVVIKLMAQFLKKEGGFLDISMLSSIKYAYSLLAPAEKALERNIEKDEMPLWGSYPCYKMYETKDKRLVVLGALESHLWNDFCQDNGQVDLVSKQFSTDEEVLKKMVELFKSKTRDEWETMDNDYCLTPVYSYLEASKRGIVSF